MYFIMVVSNFLFLIISAFEFGCPRLENQAFGNGGIAEIKFRRRWISHDYGDHFSCFWEALGPIFMNVVALEIGFEFDDF